MTRLAAPSPSAELTIERLEDGTAAWDAFVQTAEGATFCHLAAWRDVISDAFGHECRYLVARTGAGELAGVLPLVRLRSRLLGDRLRSMPFLNYGGPLGTPAARLRLAREAEAEAVRTRVHSLELRVRAPLSPADAAAPPPKLTVLLPLPPDAATLWRDGFSAKLRSQIRRPRKEGMEARFGPGELDAFYDVFARTMHGLGTPVHARGFFERIARAFPREVIFGAVYLGDRPFAAGCGFLWSGEFEMTWAGSLREYRRSAPNMLLYWAFMEEVIARGARVFNFGRSTPGSGTHRFKRQWGGIDVPLPWVRWPGAAAANGSALDGRMHRLAAAAWRRLPASAANRLGPPLARRLPWW